MKNLILAFNAILPWKHRYQWLLDSGWKCSQNPAIVSCDICWHSPHERYHYSSLDLATMSSHKFGTLVADTLVQFI